MVVVKVYIKRDPLEDLTSVEAALAKMAVALDTRSCPNVLLYQRWLQSSVSLPESVYPDDLRCVFLSRSSTRRV